MDGKAPNVKTPGPCFLAKAAKDQEGTEGLTNDGRKSYTGHIKLQENDEDEVQHHIRHATNDEEEKRPLRITNGAQRCRPIVIGHEKEGS